MVSVSLSIRATLAAQSVKNLPGDSGSIPGVGRYPGEGNGNPGEPGGLQSMGSQRVEHD